MAKPAVGAYQLKVS